MSDRDDGGFNFPEGKGMSDEGQRRKAALTQLTIIRKCIREVIGYWGHPKYRKRMPVVPAA